jgi:hypothetical protein
MGSWIVRILISGFLPRWPLSYTATGGGNETGPALTAAPNVSRSAAVNELRQFWIDSVAWCSTLSRDIEKIIMIHGELWEATARSHPPEGSPAG